MLKNLNMLGGLHRTHNIMLKLIEKGLKRQQAYKIVQEIGRKEMGLFSI